MNSSLQEALRSLLVVRPSDIDGLLKKLAISDCPELEKIPTSFHYIRFTSDGEIRQQNLIEKLCDFIICFCLNRDKYFSLHPTQARQLILEAKKKFVTSDQSGEGGELLTYFLLEGDFGLPKILTKMSLKTSGQMHVHGSDGVHLGLDDDFVTLYMVESKLHRSYISGINDALRSISDFINPQKGDNVSKENFELDVLENHLDIPEGDLRNKVKAALDPYSAEHSNLKKVYVCLIGFDIEELKLKMQENDFTRTYQLVAKKCCAQIMKRVSRDSILCNNSFIFLFVPFSSTDDFKKQFQAELRK